MTPMASRWLRLGSGAFSERTCTPAAATARLTGAGVDVQLMQLDVQGGGAGEEGEGVAQRVVDVALDLHLDPERAAGDERGDLAAAQLAFAVAEVATVAVLTFSRSAPATERKGASTGCWAGQESDV